MDAENRTLSEIMVAFLSRNNVSAAELPQLVREVRAALEPAARGPSAVPEPAAAVSASVADTSTPSNVDAAELRPAVPIEQSIHRDYLVSLEDGKHYRSLRRHLMSKYGMTPEYYRRRWNLPPDYPMVAPSYAEERSSVAKRIGLGKSANKRKS